jgi:hypothetical protein
MISGGNMKKVISLLLVIIIISGCATVPLTCEEDCSLSKMVCKGINRSNISGTATNFDYKTFSSSTSVIGGESTTFACEKPKTREDQQEIAKYYPIAEQKEVQNTKAEKEGWGWGLLLGTYGATVAYGLATSSTYDYYTGTTYTSPKWFLIPVVGPIIQATTIQSSTMILLNALSAGLQGLGTYLLLSSWLSDDGKPRKVVLIPAISSNSAQLVFAIKF